MKNVRLLVTLASSVALVALLRAAAPTLAESPESARPLAVGAKAPAVTLTTVDGADFALGPAFADKPTVLVFYRGSWCPYCNTQLAALGELEPRLLALGYQIIAVSPDSAPGLRAMAGKNQLTYRLLSDHGMVASAAYGVAYRLSAALEKAYRGYGVALTPIPGGDGYWLPVPAVFLVGRDGVIKFAYSNPDYKVRLASADLLAAAAK